MLLYALAFASAALVTIDRPARRASVPRLVAPERLASALVLDSAQIQVAKVGGPALAGLLIAWFGLPAVYIVEAVLFSLALAAVARLPALLPVGRQSGLTLGALVDGVRFVRHTPVVLSSFLIDLSAMTFGLPVALFPILARDVFGGGPEVLGLLVAAPAVGAVIGTVASGWIGRVEWQGRGVIGAVVVWALAIIAFGLTLWSLPVALVLLAISGAADVISTVFRGAILQLATPDSMRGRMSGIQILIFQGGPRLGDLEATTVAAIAGAPFSVLSGGVLCLVATFLVVLRLPALAAFRPPVAEARATSPPMASSS
jgi:predicted MFS family arabinose efflux permease